MYDSAKLNKGFISIHTGWLHQSQVTKPLVSLIGHPIHLSIKPRK